MLAFKIRFAIIATPKRNNELEIEMENLNLGNNESLSKGISKNSDGTYTALTFTKSKTFKTLNGAKKWMLKNG